MYYKKASCCLLVYDITNQNSFEECKHYYNEGIKEKCKKSIKVILLGNKTDLEDKREVSPEEGAGFALENDYIFMETSCLKNENVADAFSALIEMTNIDSKRNDDTIPKGITLNLEEHQNHNNYCCLARLFR